MITLGQVLSLLLTGNPSIVVMATEKRLEVGIPVEPLGIKKAQINGKDVLILTV